MTFMMSFYRRFLPLSVLLLITLLLSSCTFLSPEALKPEAQAVEISKNKPPESCRYVAPTEVAESSLFIDMFTSNDNLVESAYNQLRNKAYLLHANYLQVLNYHYHQSSLLQIIDFTRMPIISAVSYQCA